jgi:ubiquinone/menaquinone biosynthesis C-methylase UbiE
MTEVSRHDAWQEGDSYERYMGRWSRLIAPRFLDWLAVRDGLDWLEVGCGTGALSAAIVAKCAPRSLLSLDLSKDFLAKARSEVRDARVSFQLADAQSLPVRDASRDVIVSGLVLNFVPDLQTALLEMKRVVRPEGVIAFYVWDYPGGGVEFVHAFWTAAIALDPKAADLAEERRFAFCTPDKLAGLVRNAGLSPVDIGGVEACGSFQDFGEFWHPFTLGAGPAPGYCVSLEQEARQRLRDRLSDEIPRAPDGTIPTRVRAWAVSIRA